MTLPTMEAFGSPFDIDYEDSNNNTESLKDSPEPTVEEIQQSAERDDMKLKKRGNQVQYETIRG